MFLRCIWIGTNKLFLKRTHSIRLKQVCSIVSKAQVFVEHFEMISALLRRRVISLLISSDQINAQVDHPIMIHLATSLLQNRIASKLVLSQQVLMLLNKIKKPRRFCLYLFPDLFMSFTSTCQMLSHTSESIRPSGNCESNVVKSLGSGSGYQIG